MWLQTAITGDAEAVLLLCLCPASAQLCMGWMQGHAPYPKTRQECFVLTQVREGGWLLDRQNKEGVVVTNFPGERESSMPLGCLQGEHHPTALSVCMQA